MAVCIWALSTCPSLGAVAWQGREWSVLELVPLSASCLHCRSKWINAGLLLLAWLAVLIEQHLTVQQRAAGRQLMWLNWYRSALSSEGDSFVAVQEHGETFVWPLYHLGRWIRESKETFFLMLRRWSQWDVVIVNLVIISKTTNFIPWSLFPPPHSTVSLIWPPSE